jgi:hypothetical protein
MDFAFIRRMLFGLLFVCCLSAASFGQIGVMITIAPPPLPIYEQPVCPGDGYLWTPGYWAWGEDIDDYYWVPGTWIEAPEIGFLWTPPYWGWGGDRFLFHEGFWGPQVGFYGGIDYGFGYFGDGFEGGRWDGGHFFYNRSVLNVNETIVHNVYNTTVVHNTVVNHVSFNGGNGGIQARATARDEAVERDRHIAPVAAQLQHRQEAHSDPQQRASENRGKPSVAATARPGEFKSGAVQAREAGGSYTPRSSNDASRPKSPSHVRELPPAEKPSAPNTGNPKLDKKYQQEQEKQYAKQNKERQKMAQQQEKEDQRLAKQNADEAKKQQVEQRHAQQTQQLQERHTQQRQQMQQRQQPRPEPHAEPRPARPPAH